MKVKISDIFHVKTGVRITEEDVYSHIGDLPCVTAQTLNEGITWYADESWLSTFRKNGESVIVNEPCITWSKDGYAGKLFYRDYKFFPNDHCGVLILKDEYKELVNYKWFVYTQQDLIMSNSLQSNSQPMLYNEQMSIIEFELPTLPNGNIDIEIQNKIVGEFEKLINIKNDIGNMISKIKSKYDFELSIDNYILKKVEDIALLNKGSNQISEESIYQNFDKNGYPVYSSATENEGLMGRVSKKFFEGFHKKGKAGDLTWTTNGYAGVVFYRDTNYLYSEKCGRIIIRQEYKELINPKYLKIYLNQITYKYKTAESNNGKLDILHMSNIPVKLPVDSTGNISIQIQNTIVDSYSKLSELEAKLIRISDKIKTYLG